MITKVWIMGRRVTTRMYTFSNTNRPIIFK